MPRQSQHVQPTSTSFCAPSSFFDHTWHATRRYSYFFRVNSFSSRTFSFFVFLTKINAALIILGRAPIHLRFQTKPNLKMKPSTALRTSNAEGIILLQEGNTRAARRSFEVSIKCLLSSMESPETDDDQSIECSRCAPIAAVCLDMKETRPEYVISPEGAFAVYGKAFILQWEAIHSNHQETVAAALMFNIGITFHMEFLKIGAVKCLQSASSFYRKAHQLMVRNGDINQTSLNTVECALLLAICNNLGHCFAHVFNNSSASECQKRVQALLTGHFHQLQEEGCGFEDDFKYFCSNLAVGNSDSVAMKISPAA